MKNYKVTGSQVKTALSKMERVPGALINDSIPYRAGYIKALTDLGIIDGLTASRMLIEVETMEWKGE